VTQPLPLQAAEPGAPPTCGILVHPGHARAGRAATAEWRQFCVDPAADVAAGVDRDGRVAIWGLAPVELLEVCLEGAEPGSGSHASAWEQQRQEQQGREQQLPASWAACTACCWLPAPGAGPYLLATCGAGRLQVAAVTVTRPASRAAGADAPGRPPPARVSGVALVLDAPLPEGVHAVRSLVEVGVELTDCSGGGDGGDEGPAAEASLVALASAARHQHQQQRERDVWVVWRARVVRGAAAAAAAAASAAQQQQQQEGGAGGAASGGGWAVTLSAPEVSSVEAAEAAAGACGDAEPGSPSGLNARFRVRPDNGGGGEAASISCLHRPSRVSPFLMTGDVQGRVQIWQVLPEEAAAALSLLDGGSGGGSGAAAGAGGAVQLLQQTACGVAGLHLGGIAVGVALCTAAGYAAAATTCGEVRGCRSGRRGGLFSPTLAWAGRCCWHSRGHAFQGL
jgi:hypothetical protein